MNGKFLLDTNIIISLFRGETSVEQFISNANELFVPSIVLGELYYGALKSNRALETLGRIDDFASSCTILACDHSTAREYGQIKHALRIKGRPIPENDIWVASIARQHDLVLVTRDEHFAEVDDLEQEQF